MISMNADILIIEDEMALSLGLQALLEDLGHSVRLAENGRVGLRMLMEQRPDLVVTDLIMPEVDGVEVIKTIQSSSSMNTLPIVVLTTSPYILEENNIEGVEVLEKPLGFEETVQAILGFLSDVQGKNVGASEEAIKRLE